MRTAGFALILGFMVLSAVAAQEPAKAEEPEARLDSHGDPLPVGAVARLGTIRWRANTEVYSVSPSPDGKMLAVAGNHVLSLWDLKSGRKIRDLKQFNVASWAVAFAADGKSLYAAGQDNPIFVWDIETGKE